MYAMAPSKVPAPELYARYTIVKELRLDWEDVGERPNLGEINLLTEIIGIISEADALKSRVAARRK